MTDAKDATFEPRLSLARYAEALAYTRDYPATDHVRVLSRLGVDAADFDRACVVWPDLLLRELTKRDPVRVLAFAEAYAAAEYFARTVHPPVERIESRAVEPTAARAGVRARAMRKLPSRAAASGPGTVGPAKMQASYMKAEARDLGAPPLAATSPATAVAAAPSPGPVPPPPAPNAPIDVDATGMVDARLLAEPILPFRGASTPATPLVSPSTQDQAPPKSWKPSSSTRGVDGSTEELDLRAMVRAVSPFAPDGAAAAASAPSTPDTEETGMFMAAPDFIAAAGSEPATGPESGPMTLERYASVSAELAGGEPSEVLRRLGLDRERWVRAMSEMAARFKSEPGLEDQYRELMRTKLGHARAGKAGT